MMPNSEHAWKRASCEVTRNVTTQCVEENKTFFEEWVRDEFFERASREFHRWLLARCTGDTVPASPVQHEPWQRDLTDEECWDRRSYPFLFTMERPSASAFSNLRDAARADRLCIDFDHDISKRKKGLVWDQEEFAQAKLFVLEHDLGAAFPEFDSENDRDGPEFKLPYELCAFEMRLNGHPVIAVTRQDDEDILIRPIIGVESGWLMQKWQVSMFGINMGKYTDEGWGWSDNDTQSDPEGEIRWREIHGQFALLKFIKRQIRAVCISLDAEVCTHEVIRAPFKLNEARVRRGKLPLHDYHVLRLKRRNRAAPSGTTLAKGTRKRLHFRRGHWRHYDGFKSWVKWCLVGDPDLGFIDKEYRL